MDSNRFDNLTKTLCTGISRRDALKLLAGGTAGAVAVAGFVNNVAAECHGITCSSDANCCAGAPYCNGGTCQTSAPAPQPQAPATEGGTGGASATTVPAAGMGTGERPSINWLTAALTGGAALLAGSVLRQKPVETESEYRSRD